MRFIQNVIKSAIITFLETCDTNPRIAMVVATPALLAFLYVLVAFVISTIALAIRTILTITSGIIFVIIRGVISLFFEMLIEMLAAIPLVGIATALLVAANRVSQFIINRMPQNGVRPMITRTVEETDWTSVMDHLVNKLGPGSAVVWEGLSILRVASHNFLLSIKSGIEDLRKSRMENLRKDLSDPLNDSTTGMSGEPSQGNSNSIQQTQSYADIRELQLAGSTEDLKRRSPLPPTSKDIADTTSVRAFETQNLPPH